ncbi:MAG: hypothetical protein GYA36_19855 [Veillonellaceae bacterium]|nr:hypothetical protein [Veillonellaceae bacterium]
MNNNTLLRALVEDAFDDSPATESPATEKVAAAQPVPAGQVKIATGLTSTPFLSKLANALDFVADGLGKEGQDWSFAGYGGGLLAEPFMTETENLDGDYPDRQASGVFSGSPPETVATSGTVPIGYAAQGWTGSTSQPLPDNDQVTDEFQPGGFNTAQGIDYDAMTGLAGLGQKKASVARMRAKQAQMRVLNKLKAATLRKRAQVADASVPPPGTAGEPLAVSSGTEETGAFAQNLNDPMASVPQSTEEVIALTNQDADAANRPDLAAALGSQAVASADADTVREEVLEGASGEGDSGPKQAALANILNTSLLTRISRSGG